MALASKRTEEARRLDSTSSVILGRLPLPKSCRVNTTLYQLADNGIATEWLAWPIDRPSFLLRVESNSRMYVMNKDLAAIEATSRDTLAIMSNLDAFTSAVQRSLSNLGISDPFIRRALSVMGSGIANTSRLMVSHLHQIVMHRRDSAMWRTDIPTAMISELRHAPFLGETHVFLQDTLAGIVDKRQEQLQKELIL